MPIKRKLLLALIVAKLGCSSFTYKNQVTISGIYWYDQAQAVEVRLLFQERSSLNPLMGTTIKKNFKTEVRLVQLNTNQQETQRLLLVDGQYSAPLLIENNTIKLISVNGIKENFH